MRGGWFPNDKRTRREAAELLLAVVAALTVLPAAFAFLLWLFYQMGVMTS